MSHSARTIFLVSCVSSKRSAPAAARDLYCSDWFLKARAYVEAKNADWFILSAKYGLVPPPEVIQPYDLTLNDMTAEERRAWAQRVAYELRPKLRRGDFVIVLAGQRYREYLIPLLKEWGCDVQIPLRGMGIGKQKAWLKNKVWKSAPPEV